MKQPKKKRPKKPEWWRPPSPPACVVERTRSDGGHGRGLGHFMDRAFWLDLDPSSEPWINALATLDQHDDVEPLLKLLPPDVAPHYRDLFKRKRLSPRKRGTPATPSYDLSAAEALLEVAVARVRDLEATGTSIDDAVAQVSAENKIPDDILENARLGRRGRSRAMKARR